MLLYVAVCVAVRVAGCVVVCFAGCVIVCVAVCVAVCRSALQRVTVCCSVLPLTLLHCAGKLDVLLYVAVCVAVCVAECVAVCVAVRVAVRVAECCSVLHRVAMCYSLSNLMVYQQQTATDCNRQHRHVAVCCSLLQSVAVCLSN